MLFLSIHPQFVEKIQTGEKTIELRRRRPRSVAGDMAAIYATSPVKCLCGVVRISGVVVDNAEDLWPKVGRHAAVTSSEYYSYFAGSKKAVGIVLEEPTWFATPIPLAQLRCVWPGFQPPQGFRYLGDEQVRFLDSLATCSTWRAA